MRIKILVAEGNDLLADALAEIFMELAGGAAVCKASTVAEALECAGRVRPDLILLDAWMARGHPETTVRSLHQRSPGSVVVVMATTLDPDFSLRMQMAGASECVQKDTLATSARGIVDGIGVP
jgi:DNA-binding NarL/FixJ family response regulator